MTVRNTILLVDDDEDDRDLLQEALSVVDGHHLIFFTRGDNLLEHLATHCAAVCLVVLDNNLPGQSGIALANEVKKHSEFSSLPVVLLSTSISKSQSGEMTGLLVDVLQKPSTIDGWKRVAQTLLTYCGHRTQ